MKKTRVLIPALAMIAFSTVASIAGSVAWFTASRTTNVDAGTYAVVKTSANLDVAVNPGLATSVSNKVVSMGDNKLTDGSFDHKTGKVYQPNENGSAIASADDNGEVALTDAQLASKLERGDVPGSATGKIYSAATFQLVFTVSFGNAAGDYGLFLDNTAGKTAFTTSGTAYTAQGFRMAFYPTVAAEHGRATVLADLQDQTETWDNDHDEATAASPTAEVSAIRYVSGLSNYYGTDYAAADYDLIDENYDDALPTTAPTKTAAGQRADYLGYFAFSANADVTLTFTVVCWFEGTDPEIVNRDTADEYQSVAASLHFEAIKLAD